MTASTRRQPKRSSTVWGKQQFQDTFAVTFGPARLEGRRLGGVFELLPKLADGPVITTNFDRALEIAFEQAGCRFDEVIRGAEIDTFSDALTLNRRFLLKLHGDVNERTTRVLTRTEFERHYGSAGGPAPLLPVLLRRILVSRPLLFLGCSLNQDRPLEILRLLNEEYRLSLVHYAVIARPESGTDLANRREFLEARGIRPIWLPPGSFNLIPGLLEHLVSLRGSAASVTSRAWSEVADIVEKRVDAHSRFLVGRDRELERLDACVTSNHRGLVCILAGPGVGKTSLLAHWIRSRGQQFRFVYHFFSEKQGVTSVDDAYQNLVDQLSAMMGKGVERQGEARDEDALRRTLYGTVKGLHRGAGAPIVIVLDALDEASAPFRPPFPDPLPEGVTVIASAKARSGDRAAALEPWIERAQLSEPLSELKPDAIADWLRLTASGELADFAAERAFLEELQTKTHGLPLYLRYLTEDMAAARRTGQDVHTVLKQTPGGFRDYTRQQLTALLHEGDGQQTNPRRKRLLALMSVSAYPLREDDLCTLIGVDPTDLEQLPWKVTRWIDRRRLADGTVGIRPGASAARRGVSRGDEAQGGSGTPAADQVLHEVARASQPVCAGVLP
jgi:hypothetical protein